MSSRLGPQNTVDATANHPMAKVKKKKAAKSGDLKFGDSVQAKSQPLGSSGLLQDEGLDMVSRDSTATTKTTVTEEQAPPAQSSCRGCSNTGIDVISGNPCACGLPPMAEAEQKEEQTGEKRAFCSGAEGILENDFERGCSIVVDQVEMLTLFQVLLINVAIFLPNFIVMFGFSHVGYGVDVINMMAPTNMDFAGSGLAFIAAMLCVVFYCLDWFGWPKILKIFVLTVPGICVVGACLLKSRSYPFAPLVLVLLLIPVLAGMLRITICKSTAQSKFYSCFFFNSMLTVGFLAFTWVYWMIEKDYAWNNATKLRLADLADELWKAYRITEPATRAVMETDRDLNYALDCGPDKNVMRFSSQGKTDIGLMCKKAMTVLFTCWKPTDRCNVYPLPWPRWSFCWCLHSSSQEG